MGKPAESYINTDAILDAIESPVPMLHPGYGFFSENADLPGRLPNAGHVRRPATRSDRGHGRQDQRTRGR